MRAPAFPPDEAERLRILDSLAMVYSPAEERFDRLTRLARRLFNVSTAMVSLVADDRQWFKSRVGLNAPETQRNVSFCGHAILQDRTFIVNDALRHEDFADNPLVTGPPHVRFYAGQPLRVQDQSVGTICIMDQKPRAFSEEDMDSLQSLGALVEAELQTMVLSEVQQQLLEKLEQTARQRLIDPISQCWNAEALKQLIPREIALSTRKQDRFSYLHVQLIPDPDTIEGVDEEGGGLILREAAQRLKRSLRPYDLVAYLGAGRFAVYAPACTAEVSELLAERIRSRIADSSFGDGVTQVSIDVRSGIVSAESAEDVTASSLSRTVALALDDALESNRPYVRLII